MVRKEECLSIDDAASEVEVSRAHLYNYINFLNIQKHRFPFNRRSYITKEDVEKIKQFIAGKQSI